jgi:RNA polymerase primary sigma factor
MQRLREQEIAAALAQLNGRVRRVLKLRYGLVDGEPRTLAEVGRVLGLTRERVRQLEASGLLDLQEIAPELRLHLGGE